MVSGFGIRDSGFGIRDSNLAEWLANTTTGRQVARDAGGNGPVERIVGERFQKRDQLSGAVVGIAKLPEKRIELLAADVRVPRAATPSGHVIVELEHVAERVEDAAVHVRRGVRQVAERC